MRSCQYERERTNEIVNVKSSVLDSESYAFP